MAICMPEACAFQYRAAPLSMTGRSFMNMDAIFDLRSKLSNVPSTDGMMRMLEYIRRCSRLSDPKNTVRTATMLVQMLDSLESHRRRV